MTVAHAAQPNLRCELSETDLQEIINVSEIGSQPILAHRAGAVRVVTFADSSYKVRAYRQSDIARQCCEQLSQVPHLFAGCYGRVDRYVVLEYVTDTRPNRSQYTPDQMASFLTGIARAEPRISPDRHFASQCADLERFRLFHPTTMQLIRQYYERFVPLAVSWGLEYLEPLPANFVVSDRGRFISIDEKHLTIGPQGLSLFKPMVLREFSSDTFRQLKEQFCEEMGLTAFENPKYREFLTFYYCVCKLAYGARNNERKVVLRRGKVQWMRRAILRIIGASPTLRVREEALWRTRYRLFRCWMCARHAGGYLIHAFDSPTLDGDSVTYY